MLEKMLVPPSSILEVILSLVHFVSKEAIYTCFTVLVFYRKRGSRPSGKSFLIPGHILVLKVS